MENRWSLVATSCRGLLVDRPLGPGGGRVHGLLPGGSLRHLLGGLAVAGPGEGDTNYTILSPVAHQVLGYVIQFSLHSLQY